MNNINTLAHPSALCPASQTERTPDHHHSGDMTSALPGATRDLAIGLPIHIDRNCVSGNDSISAQAISAEEITPGALPAIPPRYQRAAELLVRCALPHLRQALQHSQQTANNE